MGRRPSIADFPTRTPRPHEVTREIETALMLGDEAVTIYAAVHGITVAKARMVLRRLKRQGRVPSKVMDGDS